MVKILSIVVIFLTCVFSSEAKVIGIMGGMGPYATIDAQRILLNEYKSSGAKKDQDYPEFVINMASKTPDRTAYLLNSNKSDPLPYLTKSLKQLENSGASVIFIDCNTAHAFIDDLYKVKKPNTTILNMIEETAISIKSENPKKVLLLATDGTLKTGIYQKYLGNDVLHPKLGSTEQKIVMDIIYGKYGIKAGYSAQDPRLPTNETPWAKLQTVLKSFPNVDKIILGCTELPLAVPQKEKGKFINPVEVVVKKAIQLSHS
ncbi:MAG: aspartate racemase [Candidatus Deianiraeaceae bacterium]|jgi:aspartate racemase